MLVKWIGHIFFIVIFLYLCYRYIQILLKLKKPIIFPKESNDVASVRSHPGKSLHPPYFSNQKTGIFIYGGMLLFVLVFYILGIVFHVFPLSFYIVLILPFSYSQDVMNLFAVANEGILSGVRFVPWRRVKSYTFIPINLQHKYYGFSKEVNTGYELKITTKGFPISCVVTSDSAKMKLEALLKASADKNEVHINE